MNIRVCRQVGAIALAAGVAASNPAQAADPGKFSFALGLTTVGPAAEGIYQWTDRVRLRGIYARSPDLDWSDDVAGIDYTLSWEGYGVMLLADYQFPSTPFFLTGGLLYTENRVTGRASGLLRINDSVVSTSLRADVRFENRWLPILAVGAEFPLTKNIRLAGNAGVAYSGGIEARLTATGSVDASDLIAEQASFEDSFLEWYPFLVLGLKFSF